MHADCGSPARFIANYIANSIITPWLFLWLNIQKGSPANECPDTGTTDYEPLVERVLLGAWQRSSEPSIEMARDETQLDGKTIEINYRVTRRQGYSYIARRSGRMYRYLDVAVLIEYRQVPVLA